MVPAARAVIFLYPLRPLRPLREDRSDPSRHFFWDAAGEPSSIWTLDPNSDLASQIYNGDSITIFGQPTANSTVGYLFNSGKVTPAFLNVTATVVPEPSIRAFVGLLLVACWWFSPKKTPNSQREPAVRND